MASRSCSRDDPAPGPGRQTGRQADHACLRIRFRDPGHDRSDPPCGGGRPPASRGRSPRFVVAGTSASDSWRRRARVKNGEGKAARQQRSFPQDVPRVQCTTSCTSLFLDSGHTRHDRLKHRHSWQTCFPDAPYTWMAMHRRRPAIRMPEPCRLRCRIGAMMSARWTASLASSSGRTDLTRSFGPCLDNTRTAATASVTSRHPAFMSCPALHQGAVHEPVSRSTGWLVTTFPASPSKPDR